MVAVLLIGGYGLILYAFLKDFLKGLRVHRANLSHFKWGFLPRFTVRLPNGRFKANKVGMFYVATH